MKKPQYTVIITKDKDGYFAEVPDLKNCWTQGETFEEVLKNAQEAIHCHIKGLKKLGEPIPKTQDQDDHHQKTRDHLYRHRA